MSYILGTQSLRALKGVHPLLSATVKRAILLTTQDFAVHDGLRTEAEQQLLVADGVSWTVQSRHLRQQDGYGHAVDLVPFIGGRMRWDWPGCYHIASAIGLAAAEQGVSLIWGGVWDRALNDYHGPPSAMQAACESYVASRRKVGRRAAIDGVHFELGG